MPIEHEIHSQFLREIEPYASRRQYVQHSNYPRPPQAGIQPNQLHKMASRGLDFEFWLNKYKGFEAETGIPSYRPRPALNWRIL